MQATIYVTNEAYQTANAIKDLDYYDRVNLCDEIPDFDKRPGYYFKNANKLKLAILPNDAIISSGANVITASLSITMPSNLRGCIFDGAPDLPAGYADIVAYWSGESINTSSSGAAYFQCPLNEYMVDLGPEPVDAPIVNDRLLSEGIVVVITGLSALLDAISPESYIEVRFPIDPAMVGLEPDDFRSKRAYAGNADDCQQYDQVYLKVADILNSPDRDRVYIDLLFNELIDYGYWY